MPNTNAAITAARITVIATIRMTPMTGDTASSFFLINTIISNTFKLPNDEQTMYNLTMLLFNINKFVIHFVNYM